MSRQPEQQRATGKWLTTFNDLVTLLLTFFVLTLSLSSLNIAKVKEMSLSISAALGHLREGAATEFRIFEPFVTPLGRVGLSMDREQRRIAETLSATGRFDVEMVPDGVLVTVDERLFFETGCADIGAEGRAVLATLAQPLRDLEGEIRVAGHTDDVPIYTDRFPSNWELSVARATGVVRHLIAEDGLQPERLSASGYADSRPRAPGTDAEARSANRRVEILILLPG